MSQKQFCIFRWQEIPSIARYKKIMNDDGKQEIFDHTPHEVPTLLQAPLQTISIGHGDESSALQADIHPNLKR